MKKLLFFIGVIFIGGFTIKSCVNKNENFPKYKDSQLLEIRDDVVGNSCLDSIAGCQHGVYTWDIIVPQYPECTFNISLEYYKCDGIGTVELHVGDFDIEPADNGLPNDCTQYYEDLEYAYLHKTEDQFIIEFNKSVWREVTKYILKGFHREGITYSEIEYNIGACKYLCYTDQLDCGHACCKRTNKWEYIEGEWVRVEEGELEHYGDNCGDAPLSFCPPDVLQSANCFDNCESLDF